MLAEQWISRTKYLPSLDQSCAVSMLGVRHVQLLVLSMINECISRTTPVRSHLRLPSSSVRSTISGLKPLGPDSHYTAGMPRHLQYIRLLRAQPTKPAGKPHSAPLEQIIVDTHRHNPTKYDQKTNAQSLKYYNQFIRKWQKVRRQEKKVFCEYNGGCVAQFMAG